jgi:hypothetical protein
MSYANISKPQIDQSPIINDLTEDIDVCIETIDGYSAGDIYTAGQKPTEPGYETIDSLLWSEHYYPWKSTSLPWSREGAGTVNYTNIDKPV